MFVSASLLLLLHPCPSQNTFQLAQGLCSLQYGDNTPTAALERSVGADVVQAPPSPSSSHQQRLC